ncbi:unnamed protein product, partial [Lampetra fluviatilis]
QFRGFDCELEGGLSHCLSCFEGRTYTDTSNNADACSACRTCAREEELVAPCTAKHDTACQCRDGFYRSPQSGACELVDSGTRTEDGKVYMSLSNDSSQTKSYGNRQHLLNEKRRQLSEDVGRNAACLLDELDSRGLISRGDYSDAKLIASGQESVASLIEVFLTAGEMACQKFLDTLYAVRDKYQHMDGFFNELDQLSIVAVEGTSQRHIRKKKPRLKEWISKDPDFLLDKMLHNRLITTIEFERIKRKPGALECADESNKIVVVPGNALHVIRGKKPELKRWLGRNPAYFLDELNTKTFVSKDVLSKAKKNPQQLEGVCLLLDYFIDGGERKCQKLLETLQDLKEKYPEIKHWLHRLEDEAEIVVVEEDIEEQISRNRDNLIQWISKDPTFLLDEMDSKWYIERRVYTQVRDKKEGLECASFLLDHFVSGGQGYQKLLVALRAVQRHYDPKLRTWLDKLNNRIVVVPGNALHVIRGKKPELKRWLGKDSSPLLEELNKKHLLSPEVLSRARSISSELERAGFLLDHFIDGEEKKCHQLLCMLQDLRSCYPEVNVWLETLANEAHIVVVEQETEAAVQGKKDELKAWIALDPSFLLDEIDSKWYAQRSFYITAKSMESKHECSAYILEHFIDGEAGYQKLLVALRAVQDHYPQELRVWLDNLGKF